jgi:hypothetical protein
MLSSTDEKKIYHRKWKFLDSTVEFENNLKCTFRWFSKLVANKKESKVFPLRSFNFMPGQAHFANRLSLSKVIELYYTFLKFLEEMF